MFLLGLIQGSMGLMELSGLAGLRWLFPIPC